LFTLDPEFANEGWRIRVVTISIIEEDRNSELGSDGHVVVLETTGIRAIGHTDMGIVGAGWPT
jgi:hypothetical protein